MAKYRSRPYAEFLYGGQATLPLSVNPMSVIVRTSSEALVTWRTPTGDFTRIRLMRNQGGYPETFEDGAIVWEETANAGNVSRLSIIDGLENPEVIPFVQGRMLYYRMFLLTDTEEWVVAGSISALVPFNHKFQEKLFGALPRVFTSIEQTPLGELDTRVLITFSGDTDLNEGQVYDFNSFQEANFNLEIEQAPAKARFVNDLYNFLGGVGFTLDELVTYLELINPKHAAFDTPASLLPVQFSNIGLTPELALPIKNQKRLVRESSYLYTRRGTKDALSAYVESLTGYVPTISVSTNIMLTPQDSTFYNSVGNWIATNAEVESSTEQLPPIDEGLYWQAIDREHSCKIVSTNIGTMSLGEDDPITKGIPIKENTDYLISCAFLATTGSGGSTDVRLGVKFFDKNSLLLSTIEINPLITPGNPTGILLENGWDLGNGGSGSLELQVLSPDTACYMTLFFTYPGPGTYYVDMFRVSEGFDGPYFYPYYQDARSINVWLDPPTYNFLGLYDPSFEKDTYPEPNWIKWAVDGTLTAEFSIDVPNELIQNNKSAKLTITGDPSYWGFGLTTVELPLFPPQPFGEEVYVEPPYSTTNQRGQYYTLSFYIKNSHPLNARIQFTGLNSSINTFFTIANYYHLIPINAEWTRYEVPVVLPSLPAGEPETLDGGITAMIIFEKESEVTPEGTIIYLDGVMFEKGFKASEFFPEYAKYPSLEQKVSRLAYTMNDWVPHNSWWAIRSWFGVEDGIVWQENGSGLHYTNLMLQGIEG